MSAALRADPFLAAVCKSLGVDPTRSGCTDPINHPHAFDCDQAGN